MPPIGKEETPVLIPDPPTISPTMFMQADVQLAYFPHAKLSLPKPTRNTMPILYIVETIQSSLEDSIFVTETQNGGTIPSGLYTYRGFMESLLLYTKFGVDGKFFYLGEEQSMSSTEPRNLDIGVANLALFLAKMMPTIAYERCEPNALACGAPALDTAFEEPHVRVQCAANSPDDGKECPIVHGCACVLGLLQHHLGMQSESVPSTEKYRVNFCETNPLQSICSRRIDQGAELRWITAMTYWVFFVQQYDEDGWSYVDELHTFVSGGMIDMSFVNAVGDLSVLGTTGSLGFRDNFSKAMVKLFEGYGRYQSNPPFPSAIDVGEDLIFAANAPPRIFADIASTAENSQQTSSSADDNSPRTVFSVVATPPTEQSHWKFVGQAWHSQSDAFDDKTITVCMVMITLLSYSLN